MLTEEQECSSIKVSIRIVEIPGNDASLQRHASRAEANTSADGRSRLFELNVAPATLAERFPRLMIFAVTACIFLAALSAEVECLRASGYYWQW